MGQAIAARDKASWSPLASVVFIRMIWHDLSQPGTWSQLALVDGQVAGFVLGTVKLDHQGRTTDTEVLEFLMITPQYWGKGIGSSLLNWATEGHRSRGVRCIELLVQEENQRARALYERHGYIGVNQIQAEHGVEVRYRLTL
jgi:ribosomal protein S18 acetylase RimI-like enzyme